MLIIRKNLRQIYSVVSFLYGLLLRYTSGILPLPPMRYTFYMTTACNFRCSYCHVLTGLNKKVDRLNIDEWFKIVEKVKPFSVVSLSGGEPLLSPESLPLIKKMKEKRIVVTMVTNGSLLTSERIDQLVDYGLDYLMISVDGMKDYHDSSRGVEGSFQKIVTALEYISRKYGTKLNVGIKTVIKEDNSEEIKSLLTFLNKYVCVSDISFNLLFDNIPNGALYSYDSLEAKDWEVGNTFQYVEESKKRVKETIRYINEYKKNTEKSVSFTLKTNTVDDLESFVDNPDLYGVKKCFVPWTDISIHSNGDVTPCLSFKYGNMREIDFDMDKVFSLPGVSKFQDHMSKTPFHKSCEGCPIALKHEIKPLAVR